MKLTHSEKAVLLEALEGYGIEEHSHYEQDEEIFSDSLQTITDVGKLEDRKNLIKKIERIKSEDPEV